MTTIRAARYDKCPGLPAAGIGYSMKTRLSLYRLGGRLAVEVRLRVRRLRSLKLIFFIPLL